MALDRNNFESNVKAAVNQLGDQDLLEEHTYSDLFALCDETAAEVPDTEINLRHHKLSNLWDSPEHKKYKPNSTSSSEIKQLHQFEEDEIELHFCCDTSAFDNKKNKRTKSKLFKRKRSLKSSNVLPKFRLYDELAEQPVPPNSPCNGTKPDVSCNSPFITCLLDVLEQTRLNGLRYENKALEHTSSLVSEVFADVQTDIGPDNEISIPGREISTVSVEELGCDDDHVVPQVSQPVNDYSNGNTATVFYDSILALPQPRRVMQSCIGQDHIVPDIIEEWT